MMRAWEHILNTAMLGTDKPFTGEPALPVEIKTIVDGIEGLEYLDKEEKFLQKAALIYNYRQCGFVSIQKTNLPLNMADAEISPYCTDTAFNTFNNLLEEDNLALLELWLTLCSKKGQLLPPEVLPAILDKADINPSIQSLVVSCAGNRGKWLSQFKPQWRYFDFLPEEEIWQTGRPEERVKLLQSIRQNNPGRARDWLQQTWPQENAASKTELLKVLYLNSSPADLPWLEGLLAEKGQKVKDEVTALLKQIPGSSIIRQYETVLGEAVTLKKEKALLVIMNKTSIRVQLPDSVDEYIFKSGIEKMSGPKSVMTDDQYIVYQLISNVPPAFWEQQFETGPAQVVQYFEKFAPVMLPAVALAVSRFNEKQWVPYFLGYEKLYEGFIDLVAPQEQEKYLLKFMEKDAQNTINVALSGNSEWGLSFAQTAFNAMAGFPYVYNRAFFARHIKLIPVNILNHLKNVGPADVKLQPAWEKTRTYILELLTLKQQTLQAFN